MDDKGGLRAALREAGVKVAEPGSLRFRDPWGNQIEVVDYRDVQFTKTLAVLAGMGLARLENSDASRAELQAKGFDG